MHYVGMAILVLTLLSFLGAGIFVGLRFFLQDKVGYNNPPLSFVFHSTTQSEAWEVDRAREAALDMVRQVYPEILREFNRIDVHVYPHAGMTGHFNPTGRGAGGRPVTGTVDLHRPHIFSRRTPRILLAQYYNQTGTLVSIDRSGFFHEVAMHVVPYLLGFGIMPDSVAHPMKDQFARLQRRMFERFQELSIEPVVEKHMGCDDC